MKPTEKMVRALRNFRIPEDEISKMDFKAASAKLNELINEIKDTRNASANSSGRTGNSPTPARAEGAPSAPPTYHKEGATIPLPADISPISDKDIDDAFVWAAERAFKEGDGDKMITFEYTIRFFDAKMEQMKEHYWLVHAKWENAMKQANIRRVKEG